MGKTKVSSHSRKRLAVDAKWGLVTFFVMSLLVQSSVSQDASKEKVIAAAEKVIAAEIAAAPEDAPGCAVGVSFEGNTVLRKAFGMAELEHKVPITIDSIFESGSVAKQFTAAALVLLEIDGKLDIDDPVRKYIPELPDYGAPLTIRHLLNHTAGLRDWGAVMGISGVGRGERIVRQDYAIHVITKQKHLDFVPGAEYSYSNSGYQLASEIVERVSGMSLPEFTKKRLFDPIGMKDTSWRDDYERLVPRRVQAYDGPPKGPWKLSMPFMNVYGNGGILTTVEDFLRWNAALDSGEWQAMADMLETQGVLNDGKKIDYALGLSVYSYNGIREVSHGGRTAGYVTFLARYPEKSLSIATLCNGPFRNPVRITHGIVNEAYGPFAAPPALPSKDLSADELKKYAGLWREDKTHMPTMTVFDEKSGKLMAGNIPLRPLGDNAFESSGSSTRFRFEFGPNGERISATRISGDGDETKFFAEEKWSPSKEVLQSIEGTWYSEEAETMITIVIDGEKIKVRLESLLELPMMPVYKDHFSVPGGSIVWIERDDKGGIGSLHVGTGRMRDLRFERAKVVYGKDQE
ncbi:MAG: beta-lactamase family protein [Aridibacter famidurans]|nr:beta-lactamase family protein [Aridibacter famidurans]